MGKLILTIIIMGVLLLLLYGNGYLVLQSKRAVMYIGSKRGKKAKFSSCTGYTKRVVKFKESREYHFCLTTELSAGEVTVELLERKGQPVLCLDSYVSEGNFSADAEKKYHLVIRFESASGSYEIDWE